MGWLDLALGLFQTFPPALPRTRNRVKFDGTEVQEKTFQALK